MYFDSYCISMYVCILYLYYIFKAAQYGCTCAVSVWGENGHEEKGKMKVIP